MIYLILLWSVIQIAVCSPVEKEYHPLRKPVKKVAEESDESFRKCFSNGKLPDDGLDRDGLYGSMLIQRVISVLSKDSDFDKVQDIKSMPPTYHSFIDRDLPGEIKKSNIEHEEDNEEKEGNDATDQKNVIHPHQLKYVPRREEPPQKNTKSFGKKTEQPSKFENIAQRQTDLPARAKESDSTLDFKSLGEKSNVPEGGTSDRGNTENSAEKNDCNKEQSNKDEFDRGQSSKPEKSARSENEPLASKEKDESDDEFGVKFLEERNTKTNKDTPPESGNNGEGVKKNEPEKRESIKTQLPKTEDLRQKNEPLTKYENGKIDDSLVLYTSEEGSAEPEGGTPPENENSGNSIGKRFSKNEGSNKFDSAENEEERSTPILRNEKNTETNGEKEETEINNVDNNSTDEFEEADSSRLSENDIEEEPEEYDGICSEEIAELRPKTESKENYEPIIEKQGESRSSQTNKSSSNESGDKEAVINLKEQAEAAQAKTDEYAGDGSVDGASRPSTKKEPKKDPTKTDEDTADEFRNEATEEYPKKIVPKKRNKIEKKAKEESNKGVVQPNPKEEVGTEENRNNGNAEDEIYDGSIQSNSRKEAGNKRSKADKKIELTKDEIKPISKKKSERKRSKSYKKTNGEPKIGEIEPNLDNKFEKEDDEVDGIGDGRTKPSPKSKSKKTSGKTSKNDQDHSNHDKDEQNHEKPTGKSHRTGMKDGGKSKNKKSLKEELPENTHSMDSNAKENNDSKNGSTILVTSEETAGAARESMDIESTESEEKESGSELSPLLGSDSQSPNEVDKPLNQKKKIEQNPLSPPPSRIPPSFKKKYAVGPKPSNSIETISLPPAIVFENTKFPYFVPDDFRNIISVMFQALSDLPCSDPLATAIQKMIKFLSQGLHLFPLSIMTPCTNWNIQNRPTSPTILPKQRIERPRSKRQRYTLPRP